ncbi:MAG: sulfatase-like hydrolase/transferase [Chitinophagaceae bacterium]|nr:sulfatase-like hydrolase/transferase [Chitinophagaceae bacterium]
MKVPRIKNKILIICMFLAFGLAAQDKDLVYPLAGNYADSEQSKQLGTNRRPNILFLLSDDQRWDSQGCFGNTVVTTPEIDRLASEGVKFNNSFVTFSVCSASRAVIMTGIYSRSRSGGADNLTAIATPRNWNATLPALLKDNGYFTGYIGKWDCGVGEDGFQIGMNLFDYWGGDRWHGNYWHERNCNFVTNDGMEHKSEIRCTCVQGTPWESSFPRTGFSGMVDPVHTDIEVVPLKVKTFLDSRDQDKPFFLQISFRAPKDPWSDYPLEVKDYYTANKIPVSPTANIENALSQLKFLQGTMGTDHARNVLSSEGKLENEIRKHYRLVTGIDIAIGKSRNLLDEAGVDNNTIIVFSSDNGAFLGEHGFWGKWLPYEESICVPLIVYDPRVPSENRGKTVDEMVLNVDYTPTFLSYAGITAPDEMQGMDIRDLLSGNKEEWRKDWYYEHTWTAKDLGANVVPIVPSEAVRTDEWKYIVFYNEEPDVEQLFNIKEDPYEINNLISNPEYVSILSHLRGRLEYYRGLYTSEQPE